MRKILSQEEINKKERKNKLIISIVLVLVMLLSTLGYAFFSSDRNNAGTESTKVEYNSIIFNQNENHLWNFDISGYSFETNYNPKDTENISVIMTKTVKDYQNKVIYFGADAKEDISQEGNQEIYANINRFILRSNFACLSENCTEDYPIKNCSDNNIIIFKEDDEGITKIRDDGGCVYIYYNQNDEMRAADAFLFKILGVQG